MHCSVRASYSVTEKELTLSEWKRVIEEFASIGGKEVVITGGEPLLHKDILEILEFAKLMGLSVRLYSAGYLVNDHTANLLTLADMVCVSLEGDQADHERVTGVLGSYGLTIKGLERMASVGARLRLHFTPMKINFRSFPHVVAIANRLRVVSLKVLNFVPEGRGSDNVIDLALDGSERQEFAVLLSQARAESLVPITYGGEVVPGASCGIGDKLLITSDGFALPCLGLRGQNGLRVGNVKEQSLSTICDSLRAMLGDGSCLCQKIHRSTVQ